MKPTWIHVPSVLSPEECQKIIDQEKDNVQQARVANNKDQRAPLLTRISSTSWIQPGSPVEHQMRKVMGMISRIALDHLSVLINQYEAPQFTHYGFLGHYKQHTDCDVAFANRLVSASVQLNNTSEFSGGKLWFKLRKNNIPNMRQGDLVVFPSYMSHKVTPVWRGQRYSLVVWGGYSHEDAFPSTKGAKNDG